MARSNIEWTGFVWNFILGCTKCSPGCKNCYAMKEVARERCAAHKGLAVLQPTPNWTGLLRFRPESLNHPLLRKAPTKWFVNSLSDFFHEYVPVEWQVAGLNIMQSADWHIFQVLTKRERKLQTLLEGELSQYARLPNVMWGVSVEDRKHGLPRIDALRNSAARIKWLSIEPLLEDLGDLDLTGIDWVVVGGESGHQARPIKQDWVLSIKDSCDAHGVPFFFKQWGNWAPAEQPCGGRIHTWPDATLSVRKSKKDAGRLLLGQNYDGQYEFKELGECPSKIVRGRLRSRCSELASSISVLEAKARDRLASEDRAMEAAS